MDLSSYQGYHEGKAHSSAAFPYNTYLCTIPLDFTLVPLHWHDDAELIVVKKGAGSVTVDFTNYTVSAGELILVLPGHLHAISEIPGKTMEYENILFSPSLLSGKSGDLCSRDFVEPFFSGQMELETLLLCPSLSWYPEVWNLITEIDRLCDSRPTGYQLAVKSALFRFVFLFLPHTQKNSGTAKAPKSLEKLKTIVQYVEANYAEPITVEEMADLSGYSKSHFMKFFRSCMGKAFVVWLNDYRLTMAARMLKISDSSILEISESSGFRNLSYFNRMFRRKYHKTPREYRQTL